MLAVIRPGYVESAQLAATLTVDAVLNCTGTCTGVRTSSDPLVMNLLESGTARPGSLDLGFARPVRGRIFRALSRSRIDAAFKKGVECRM